MSYDLTCFRVRDGEDAEVAYRALREREERDALDLDAAIHRALPEAVRAEMEKVAEAVLAWRPSLERFHPTRPLPWIELNDPELPVQITIGEESVNLSMSYGSDQSPEIFTVVGGCLDVLHRVAGYAVYDPQLDRLVTAADVSEMARSHAKIHRVIPEMIAAGRKKPWWKFW